MHRSYLIKLLLTPSILSGALCVAITALVLGLTAWSFISERQLFYDYLFGLYGFNTLLVEGPDTFWVLRQSILGSSATYFILIILCSLLVGVLVYALLEGLRLTAHETSSAWRNLHTPGSAYSQEGRRKLARQLSRGASLVGWALYTAIFVNVLIPASMVLTRAGVDDVEMASAWGWVRLLEAFILLAVSLHIHVIFIRLVALRPRVLGGSDLEIAESQR